MTSLRRSAPDTQETPHHTTENWRNFAANGIVLQLKRDSVVSNSEAVTPSTANEPEISYVSNSGIGTTKSVDDSWSEERMSGDLSGSRDVSAAALCQNTHDELGQTAEARRGSCKNPSVKVIRFT